MDSYESLSTQTSPHATKLSLYAYMFKYIYICNILKNQRTEDIFLPQILTKSIMKDGRY